MSADLSILNKMIESYEAGVPFKFDEEAKSVSRLGFWELLGNMDRDGAIMAEKDGKIAKYIAQQLTTHLSGTSEDQEIRSSALKAANHFKQHISGIYTDPGAEINSAIREISEIESVVSVSNKLNIPFEILVENKPLVQFILKNHLHHRIDHTYQERGFGPRVDESGNVFFWMNEGSSFNSDQAKLVPWQDIPTDQSGKITEHNYGPFGFEPYPPFKARVVRPIKLMDKPPLAPEGPRIEIVTTKPTYVVSKIPSGSLGHSWLRLYTPELDKDGTPTGKEFVYSVGYFLRDCLLMPDLTEFTPGNSKVSNSYAITENQLSETIVFFEELQKAFLGDAVDEETKKIQEEVSSGLCTNFAAFVMSRVSKNAIQFDARMDAMKYLEPFTSSVGTILKPVSPEPVSRWTTRLIKGYMPWNMVILQNKLNMENKS